MAEYNTPNNSLANKGMPQASSAPIVSGGAPKVSKIVSGNATLKQPTRAEKLREDGKNALKNVMTNTVAPSLKDLILNAIWNGLSMIFFPDGSRRPSSGGTPAGRVYYGSGYNSYGSMYRSGTQQPKAVVSQIEPVFRNPLLPSLQDANAVIDGMRDTIRAYGFATWATLYDLCGVESQNWQGTTKYGWMSVESTMINTVHTADGQIVYELRMPKASPIDDMPG